MTSKIDNTDTCIELKTPFENKPLHLHIHDNKDEMISRKIRDTGLWEPYETEVLLNHLNKGDTFIDIGANIGYYSVIAANRVGEKGKVISYEPQKNNFHLLKKSIETNEITNAKIFNYGLSDENTQSTLFLNNENNGDHRIYDDGSNRKTESIELVNATRHITEQSSHVDFIKIDTQGAEYNIVKGLEPIIAENQKSLKMIIEFWPYGLRLCGASGLALWRLLNKYEFDIFNIDHTNCQLTPMSKASLRWWIKDVDKNPTNEGFLNLFLIPKK